MRASIAVLILALAACGGDSGTEPEPEPQPDPASVVIDDIGEPMNRANDIRRFRTDLRNEGGPGRVQDGGVGADQYARPAPAMRRDRRAGRSGGLVRERRVGRTVPPALRLYLHPSARQHHVRADGQGVGAVQLKPIRARITLRVHAGQIVATVSDGEEVSVIRQDGDVEESPANVYDSDSQRGHGIDFSAAPGP